MWICVTTYQKLDILCFLLLALCYSNSLADFPTVEDSLVVEDSRIAEDSPTIKDFFAVEDIQVKGLQRVSAATVFTALPFAVGATVTLPQLQEAVRALFRTGLFADIQLGREGNILVVVI